MTSVILIIVALIFCYAIAWHDRGAVSSTIVVRKNERPRPKARQAATIHAG
jgi:hypothetical protein